VFALKAVRKEAVGRIGRKAELPELALSAELSGTPSPVM